MSLAVKNLKLINDNLIELFKISYSPAEVDKTILFIGVTHGDEPEGEALIYKLMDEIDKNPKLIANNQILFIPCLNPDGKELCTRTNANGVDLNRNFPTKNWELSKVKDDYYSGTEPASEAETRFLIEVIQEYKPDITVTIHNPYRVVNYDGPAKELAEEISRLNGYPVQESIGYPTPGSFGTYCGIERNCQTITIELPDNINIETLWKENKQAFLAVISK